MLKLQGVHCPLCGEPSLAIGELSGQRIAYCPQGSIETSHTRYVLSGEDKKKRPQAQDKGREEEE